MAKINEVTDSREGRYIHPDDLTEHDPKHTLKKRHSPVMVWLFAGGMSVIALVGILMYTLALETPPGL